MTSVTVTFSSNNVYRNDPVTQHPWLWTHFCDWISKGGDICLAECLEGGSTGVNKHVLEQWRQWYSICIHRRCIGERVGCLNEGMGGKRPKANSIQITSGLNGSAVLTQLLIAAVMCMTTQKLHRHSLIQYEGERYGWIGRQSGNRPWNHHSWQKKTELFWNDRDNTDAGWVTNNKTSP